MDISDRQHYAVEHLRRDYVHTGTILLLPQRSFGINSAGYELEDGLPESDILVRSLRCCTSLASVLFTSLHTASLAPPSSLRTEHIDNFTLITPLTDPPHTHPHPHPPTFAGAPHV
jgi:hypothetical protein